MRLPNSSVRNILISLRPIVRTVNSGYLFISKITRKVFDRLDRILVSRCLFLLFLSFFRCRQLSLPWFRLNLFQTNLWNSQKIFRGPFSRSPPLTLMNGHVKCQRQIHIFFLFSSWLREFGIASIHWLWMAFIYILIPYWVAVSLRVSVRLL